MLTVVNEDGSTHDGSSLIDEIVRDGARRMLAAALEAEVNAYVAELADQRDENGRRLVVRNGYHQPRQVTTAAGVVEVKAPRVNDERVDEATGERKRFSSAILPPWCRKSPKISEVLPLLYLHGLSSGDFVPALEQFLGSSAGLSPATVTRLTTQWQADHKAFGERDLAGYAPTRFTTEAELLAFLDTATTPPRTQIMESLSHPRLTGMSREDLDTLARRLAPRQLAQIERASYQRRGADRQPGSRGGIFPQKIGDKERVILAVLYLRKLCTLDVLADAPGDVSRSLIGNVVREIRPLLMEGGLLPPPTTARYRTATELLAAHSEDDTPTS